MSRINFLCLGKKKNLLANRCAKMRATKTHLFDFITSVRCHFFPKIRDEVPLKFAYSAQFSRFFFKKKKREAFFFLKKTRKLRTGTVSIMAQEFDARKTPTPYPKLEKIHRHYRVHSARIMAPGQRIAGLLPTLDTG